MRYVITLSKNINKQAGSLMTWSTQRISSTTVQWVSPWELYNYWMNIKCVSLKKKKRETWSESITWRQNQSHNEVFAILNAGEEQGRRPTAQIFHNYQQRLHKQHCSAHLPGVCHICAQRPQLLPKAENEVFTPLKKQAIHYHLLIPNMTPSE